MPRLKAAYFLVILLAPLFFDAVAMAHESSQALSFEKHEPRFDHKKVRLVDTNHEKNNLLFRGNMPIIQGQFVYDPLMRAMSDESEKKLSQPLPENLLILDISLISNITESRYLTIERHFARANPNKLLLIHHPIYGALTSPDHHHHALVHHFMHIPFLEGVYQLIESLHGLMNRDLGRPVAIFVHCKAGSDRTGMIIGAYQMQYLGMSYQDVVKQAEEVAGRPIKFLQHNGLKWIAYYYRDVLGIHTVGEI